MLGHPKTCWSREGEMKILEIGIFALTRLFLKLNFKNSLFYVIFIKGCPGDQGYAFVFSSKNARLLNYCLFVTAVVIYAVVALYVAAVANLTVVVTVVVVDIRGFCCCCCALCWS